VAGAPPRWGWHQLDSKRAAQLVEDAGIGPGDLVLDIGAGRGALCEPLLELGARVIAFELNQARAAELRRRFDRRQVTVVTTDVTDLRLPRQPFRVVANPPFGITVALLRRLVAPGSRLQRADIVVPWHTARKWVSGGGPGSGRWLRSFEVGLGRPLPRSAFRPPPPSGVAVLILQRRPARRPGRRA
jgi:23S rRNA (adenine-N6)-dimethyltransferase